MNPSTKVTRRVLLGSWCLASLPRINWAAPDDVRATEPKGHLLIHGGGSLTRDVLGRFQKLGGGELGHLVYVPTSQEGEIDPSPDSVPGWLSKLGFGRVTVLHTRDPEVADREDFSAPLETATAIWFSGGRQWRTMDAYLGTRTAEAFHAAYHRGAVIGGSSAGATVQGSYLVRGAPEGNQIMMAPGHEKGFGFMPDTAIDQHAIARKRLDDMVPVIEKHPHLLGIAIDEGTALHVHAGVATILGKSKVAFYDAGRWENAESPRYLLLEKNARFRLTDRRVLPAINPAPAA